MNERSVVQLAQDAHAGRLSRRQVLAAGLQLGLATPVIAALMAAAPEASAAPGRPSALGRSPGQEGGDTFTIIVIGGTEDIDPHSTYSTIGSAICYGVYDMLIKYKGESTAEYDPMLAESWEANPENTVFTFKIKPNVLFHDGTACDATAVKASFTRFFDLGLGPSDNVLKRFIDSPDAIEVVDATTVRFTTPGRNRSFSRRWQQLRSVRRQPDGRRAEQNRRRSLGAQLVSVRGGRHGSLPAGRELMRERIVFERFEEYHGGWEGKHFDQISSGSSRRTRPGGNSSNRARRMRSPTI